MTKRYTILQKKLKKLESELHQVFALPPTDTAPYQQQQQDIRQHFLFLTNLLSAEVASRPTKPNPHLQHIAQRLSQLEAAFHEWETTAHHHPHHHHHVGESEAAGSTCSCTDSCLNDDGDSSTLAALEEAAEAEAELSLHGLGLEGFDEEKPPPQPQPQPERSRDCRKEEGRVWGDVAESRSRNEQGMNMKGVWFGIGKLYLGALASGVVVGMGLMAVLMLRWCACFHYSATDYSYCPTPT